MGGANTMPGFDLEEVGHLKYGRRIHLWDFEKKEPEQTFYLGEDGLIPLEVRFHHDPESTTVLRRGAVGQHHPLVEGRGRRMAMGKDHRCRQRNAPRLADTRSGRHIVILLSMDDRFLYFCNWLHGDIRQYDISDPHNPKPTGQVWMGGLLNKAPEVNGVKVTGGPQMIQLSLDGKRLYVTTSLFSTWDNSSISISAPTADAC